MKTKINNEGIIRAIKFTLFSISAGIIEIVLFALLDNLTNLNYWACYLPALIASIIWNYYLNKQLTFKSNVDVKISLFKVFIFYLFFTPASTILGSYLADTLQWNGTIVTLLNMLFNFVLEFLYDRFIVFGNTIDTLEKNK